MVGRKKRGGGDKTGDGSMGNGGTRKHRRGGGTGLRSG